MESEKALEKGTLNIIEGSDHRPVSSLAVQMVGSKRKKALIMDGSRTVDPYFMVRECKSAGLDEREILEKIMISRAFTAYQYIDLVEKAEKKLKRDEIVFLGVVALSPLFEDEEMNQEEGKWLRSRLIKKIKKLVKEERLYGVIVDPKMKVLQKRNREEKDLLSRNTQKEKYMNPSSVSFTG